MDDQATARMRVRALGIVIALFSLYTVYFAHVSVQRTRVLWASYFDLGIMNQTVYNTYQSIRTLDPTRFLELTDPHGSGSQIRRMAIHSDALLALVAPLYFIHPGFETLLVLQALVLASGALALYWITGIILRTQGHHREEVWILVLQVVVPVAYLLYPPLQRSNLYEFHAVTLATGLTLWMYLAFLKRHWVICAILTILVLMSKEQTGVSVGIFLALEAFRSVGHVRGSILTRTRSLIVHSLSRRTVILLASGCLCVLYALLSVFVIIPYFRQGLSHFALGYYDTGGSDILGALQHYASSLVHPDVRGYIGALTAPLLFLPLFSPSVIPAFPDFLINTLSSSANMRSIHFQYTALITPWLFISLVYALRYFQHAKRSIRVLIPVLILLTSVCFSWTDGSLPWSRGFNRSVLTGRAPQLEEVREWSARLADESITVSTTGQLSPYFTNRRYFYDFGEQYERAEYVLIRKSEIDHYWIPDTLPPIYRQLVSDPRYMIIDRSDGFEVYQRID